MRVLIKLLIGTVAVAAAAYLVPGVTVRDYWTALVVAIVLGLLNVILRPLLVFLTLPATLLSFGLFLFVINACLVLLAAQLVPGFAVAGFWTAMLFSMVSTIIGWFLAALGGE